MPWWIVSAASAATAIIYGLSLSDDLRNAS